MLIQIFSFSFDSMMGGFNDQEMRDFLKDKELLSANEHFFVKNDVPYLTFVLKYQPYRAELTSTIKDRPSGREEEWKKLITDADKPFFDILRSWRSQRCQKEGIPPYAVFNNVELAQIVKTRPQSMSELMQIKGVGKAKADKYGADILGFSKVDVGGPNEATVNNNGT